MEVNQCEKSSCFHINGLKSVDMLSSYELLHAYYVACIIEGSVERKIKDCVCKECVKSPLTGRRRIHACLSCIFFGCFEDHIHLHSEKENHPIAMDTNTGEVYCFICKEYKYDSDFIKIARDQNAIASDKRSTITGMSYKWEPSAEEVHLLRQHKIVNSSRKGVRGLYNFKKIGTCYLNVIIQCLIHTPLFRDYLLSFQHNCDQNSRCFICHMSNILQKCILGGKRPFVPSDLLWLIFKRIPKYGPPYERNISHQDAYELYTDLLDNFHKDETRESDFYTSEPCQCIIHTIFAFEFCKKLICNNCGYRADRGKYPTFGINLYVSGELTLSECLKRKFDETDNFTCPKCNVQCAMHAFPEKLPYVLAICIYYDDFDKNSSIEFDKDIDLSPIMLPSGMNNKEKNANLQYKYFLFAVVYLKSINNDFGHYLCNIRKSMNRWFFCNDKEIESGFKTDFDPDVKERILFYHRMYL